MSVEVKNITKTYNSQVALNDVSFTIKAGEIVGFLGPNGAGKSTMMKIICGYLSADSGTVEVCGIDINTDSISARQKIGYLPEHNPLYLDLYVKEFLTFIGGIHKIENLKERVQEIVDLVGLGDEQNKKIGQLSKGYRQRVGLAHALIHDPEVLILDEPTTGLDPNQIVEIRKLIQEVGKNKTVMLSTHIMQEVEAICNRAMIIDKGVIVADKSIEELKSQNSTGFIFKVEFENEIDVEGLKGISGITNVTIKSERVVEIYSTEDNRALISRWSINQNNMITNMVKQDQTLEQTFQKLTK